MSFDSEFSYNGGKSVSDLKIGYFKALFEADSSDSGSNAMAVLAKLRSYGHQLTPVQLPEGLPYPSYDIILRAEAGAFFDQLVLSGGDATMVEQDEGSRANSLRQSRFIPAVEYLQANRHRRSLIESFHETIKDYDVILTPTFGGRQLLYTNLTGHPAIAIPSGFDSKNKPTSITLIGNLFDEESILLLADNYQSKNDNHREIPPLFKP